MALQTPKIERLQCKLLQKYHQSKRASDKIRIKININ